MQQTEASKEKEVRIYMKISELKVRRGKILEGNDGEILKIPSNRRPEIVKIG